jgi:hypothetical protein
MRPAIVIIWGILLLGATAAIAGAPAGEPVAVVTELRTGQGEIQVRLAADPQWKAPLPLLSLRPGDQLRASGNAAAVLLFTGSQGSVTVSAANSPYTVALPTSARGGQAPALVGTLTGILMGKKKELTYVPLATRSVKQPPLLLFPRRTALLRPPTFEWGGSDRLRYTVRVLGPQGPLWEQADLPRAPLAYPPSAPPLQPGIPYQWQLEVKGFPLQQTEFRLLPPERSAAVRSDLASLDPARLAGYPKNTVLLMRAGYLFEQELYDEARRELQAAIAADPDEPNLHVMLGNLYEAIGLADLAAEEFDEAQFLSTRKH